MKGYTYFLEKVKGITSLQDIPEEFKTAELCGVAVRENGHNLEFVHEQLKTLEMCKEGVENSWCALEYVPLHLRTKELCRVAVDKDYRALQFVPKTYNYSVTTHTIWTSFDNGQVSACNIEEARKLAIEKLNQDFNQANLAFESNYSTMGFRIDFDESQVEISEDNMANK